MCVTYFAWLHPRLPDLPLLCLFNRDEILGRPTEASHFWRDAPRILGGRDLVAGGTWFAVDAQSGRLALLTNFRELRDKALSAPSRGALPVSFVSGGEEPAAFLAGLDSRAYPGFNLLAADVPARRMAYMCSKDEERGPQAVPPGVHGLTNGHIDAHDVHWPKIDEGCRRLQQLLDSGAFAAPAAAAVAASAEGGDELSAGGTSSSGSGSGAGGPGGPGGSSVPWGALFDLLSDDRRLEEDPGRLPDTGYGPDFEAAVSSIFVQPVDTRWGPFGTRSQLALAVWADGRAELQERYRDEAAPGGWAEVRHAFRIGEGGGDGGGGGGESGGQAAAAEDSSEAWKGFERLHSSMHP